MNKKNKFKVWEISLLVAVCVTMCTGIYARREQNELASKIIRLHVIASSDSDKDQALKLKVRDSILETAGPLLANAENVNEARQLLSENLPVLKQAAEHTATINGSECEVRAVIGLENYPTRVYDTFSLPAGEYTSLRIMLGEGGGKNWWCVVYPALCIDTASEEITEVGGLDDRDVALITEESGGYVLKFKLLELWGALRKGK